MIDRTLLTRTLAKINFHPDIDLFASRLNAQFPRYVAFKPDPGAVAIDALTLNLSQYNFYAFPPLSVIATFLHKVQEVRATGLCVIPSMVPKSDADVHKSPNQTGTGKKPAPTAGKAKRKTPSEQIVNPSSLPLNIRQQLSNLNLPSDTIDILLPSWRKTTGRQ